MIATAIPHAAFNKPDCGGYLDIFGKAGMIVEFVCGECGEAIACARDDDMAATLKILNFAAGLKFAHCPRCGLANRVAGLHAIYAFACHNCGRSFDLLAPQRPPAF
jgi:transcription elongation factor Elf1